MSTLSNFIIPERVVKGALINSRKRVFEVLGHLLDIPEETGSDKIYQKLLGRERLGSTAVGYGVALPHARVEGVSLTKMAVIVLDKPIAYDAPDGDAIDIFIGVIFPEDVKDVHLDFMAHLTGLLRSESFRKKIRQADSNEVLYETLTATEV
ncbi:PTS sugar transporter subunit IIA [Thiotrichales bacterium 19S3-7]|nr:PTS sugar transporter subunit IIA [Thiotrichales bacterium 19S3-7]MCF6801104.1 PTS sugar transporter subunit IIA [Thiotrichales bacterium 19S3-11]